MKKVTENQIEQLYVFVQKHYVEWYDVQTELVDHLANDIESIWKEQPTLEFEKAKIMAFNKFGVFGFEDIVKARESGMYKNYFKYFINELKIWFRLPKIIITITLFLMFYTAFSSVIAYYLYFIFYGILVCWSVYKLIKHNKEYKRRKMISNKSWLLESLLYKQAGGIVFILCCQAANMLNVSDNWLIGNSIFFMSFLFTVLYLSSYISLELLPKTADELLKKTYPEYILS